jgi:hypothetical protein
MQGQTAPSHIPFIGATPPAASGDLLIQVRNSNYSREEHIRTRSQHKTHKKLEGNSGVLSERVNSTGKQEYGDRFWKQAYPKLQYPLL